MNEAEVANTIINQLLTSGGSSGVTLGIIYWYYQTKAKSKHEELNRDIGHLSGKIKHDRDTFIEFQADFHEVTRRLDKLESRVDDDVTEVKHRIELNSTKNIDLKANVSNQEMRLKGIEEKERRISERTKDMSSDMKLIEQDIKYISRDISDMKTALSDLTKAVTDLKDELIKLVAKNG